MTSVGLERETFKTLAQKFLYLTRVSCSLQTQLKWTAFLQRQENCLTSCQAPSLELVKDEPQKKFRSSVMLEKAPKMKNKGPNPHVFDHSHLNKLLLTQSSPTDKDFRTWPWAPSWNASKALESLGSGNNVNLPLSRGGLGLPQEQTLLKLFWLSCSQSQLNPMKILMHTKITISREWQLWEPHVLSLLQSHFIWGQKHRTDHTYPEALIHLSWATRWLATHTEQWSRCDVTITISPYQGVPNT